MVRPKGAPVQRFSNSLDKSKNNKTFKRRRKPGAVALKEIKYLTRTVHLLIPKICFQRLVKEICNNMGCFIGVELKIQAAALQALQEACEMYFVQLFEDCQTAAFHAKRVTVMVSDMTLILKIRGLNDIYNQ